ncbi:hypothetical protein [Stieleria varia]|uniref:hypothetical protein n=1 Tax=Stieleria varia TaxID=2528005 RepID=UPI001E44277F|nr:hypothetical protein [Stieleria varia]
MWRNRPVSVKDIRLTMFVRARGDWFEYSQDVGVLSSIMEKASGALNSADRKVFVWLFGYCTCLAVAGTLTSFIFVFNLSVERAHAIFLLTGVLVVDFMVW